MAEQLSPNEVINSAFQLHAAEHLDTHVPPMDLARLADMAVAALREAGQLPVGEPEVWWCMFAGGKHPDDSAFMMGGSKDEVEHMARWTKGGRIARRTVHFGPWTVVTDHA